MPYNPPTRDIDPDVNRERRNDSRHDKTRDLEDFAQKEEDRNGPAENDVEMNNRRTSRNHRPNPTLR